MTTEELRESILSAPKNGYSKLTDEQRKEMEAYALYLNAAAAGKNALALLTISDSLVTGEALPAQERQVSFTDMMKIALEIA